MWGRNRIYPGYHQNQNSTSTQRAGWRKLHSWNHVCFKKKLVSCIFPTISFVLYTVNLVGRWELQGLIRTDTLNLIFDWLFATMTGTDPQKTGIHRPKTLISTTKTATKAQEWAISSPTVVWFIDCLTSTSTHTWDVNQPGNGNSLQCL
jgi:hypothetical protein